MSIIKTDGRKLPALLAQLRRQRRRVTSLSVRRVRADWILAVEDPPSQAELDLMANDVNTLAPEREAISRLEGTS